MLDKVRRQRHVRRVAVSRRATVVLRLLQFVKLGRHLVPGPPVLRPLPTMASGGHLPVSLTTTGPDGRLLQRVMTWRWEPDAGARGAILRIVPPTLPVVLVVALACFGSQEVTGGAPGLVHHVRAVGSRRRQWKTQGRVGGPQTYRLPFRYRA